MAERKCVYGLTVRVDGDTAIIHLGCKQIWDGADLSLFRHAFRRQVQKGHWSIGVDLSGVQYIPGGFFGELMDWSDRGISIELLFPHEKVLQMRWFKDFFEQLTFDRHVLKDHNQSLPGYNSLVGKFSNVPCPSVSIGNYSPVRADQLPSAHINGEEASNRQQVSSDP